MFDFILPQALATINPTVQECVVAPQNYDAWNCPLRIIATRHLAAMSNAELDEDWKLNEFFGSVIVINLPQAHERLKTITQELHNIGAEFELFHAIDGRQELNPSIWKKIVENRDNYDLYTPEGRLAQQRSRQGAAGCYMSHYRLIQQLKNGRDNALRMLQQALDANDTLAIMLAHSEVRKYSRVLILEDDCGFGIVNQDGKSATLIGVGLKWRQTLQTLPDDWDMLYLMAHATEPTETTSTHLRKLKRSAHTVAYAINYTMYEPLLAHLKKIENPNVKKVDPVDHAISSIHHLHKIYAVYPSIAFQQSGQSYISARSTKLVQKQPVK